MANPMEIWRISEPHTTQAPSGKSPAAGVNSAFYNSAVAWSSNAGPRKDWHESFFDQTRRERDCAADIVCRRCAVNHRNFERPKSGCSHGRLTAPHDARREARPALTDLLVQRRAGRPDREGGAWLLPLPH